MAVQGIILASLASRDSSALFVCQETNSGDQKGAGAFNLIERAAPFFAAQKRMYKEERVK